MHGFSTELLYLLAFVAIGLLRYLWDRLRRVQPWEERLARQQREQAEAGASGGAMPSGPATSGPATSGTSVPGTASPGTVITGPSRAEPEVVRIPRASHAPRPDEARARMSHARESGPWSPRRAPSQPPAPAPAVARRRFSRRALFGDRRRTQDAVVAATILGPCRAAVPYDGDR